MENNTGFFRIAVTLALWALAGLSALCFFALEGGGGRAAVVLPSAVRPPPKTLEQWVARGKEVTEQYHCASCHGPGLSGGVENANYARGTVPALASMPEKLFLQDSAAAAVFLKLLASGHNPENSENREDIPRYAIVGKQYASVRNLILNGSRAAKLDSSGPEPPLQMPAWNGILDDTDIRAVIAYGISLHKWPLEESW